MEDILEESPCYNCKYNEKCQHPCNQLMCFLREYLPNLPREMHTLFDKRLLLMEHFEWMYCHYDVLDEMLSIHMQRIKYT